MRLDLELVVRNITQTRTEAQECIRKGYVLVNGQICIKQNKHVADMDMLTVISGRKYVSRGGEKLEGIFTDIFKDRESTQKFVSGKNALDIGSSTGGFTDFLLQNGIEHVDAVDVGTDQMHEKIKNNVRVSLYENTDIRKFSSGKTYAIIVADLSFIPLAYVFEVILSFSSNGSHLFLLIKPQFEVGAGNTKKGIVKDQTLIERILQEYTALLSTNGILDIQVFPSHIQGGDGNQEYFIYGVKE